MIRSIRLLADSLESLIQTSLLYFGMTKERVQKTTNRLNCVIFTPVLKARRCFLKMPRRSFSVVETP